MSVLVIGSLNVDYNVVVDNLPKLGETINAQEFFIEAGGKGANQAVACARLGASVSMIGKVGNDADGEMLKSLLKEENINIDGIMTSSRPTGNAMITVDKNGNNTIVVYPGANGDLTRDDIDAYRGMIESSKLIVMQLEIPLDTVEYVAQIAKEKGIAVILNPAPAKALPDSLISNITILTPNETELVSITGISDLKEAAKSLLDRGVKEVIVTMGREGCMFVSETQDIIVPSYNVASIDTTAAGDSFNGAFAANYFTSKSKESLLDICNKVGGLTTTKKGAISSLPYQSDLEIFEIKRND